MLKVGTFLRKSVSVAFTPFRVASRLSFEMDEKGSDRDRHLVHFQSQGKGKLLYVSFSQPR